MKYLLFIFFVALVSTTSLASTGLSYNKDLAQHPYWHKLLRYHADGDGYISDVTSAEYFISADGRTNPEQELEQTILNLFATTPTEKQTKLKCKFVERHHWLTKQLKLAPDIYNLQDCDDFHTWARLELLKSASFIYASGYLGNPASFFGHLLLKLNYNSDKLGSNSLLDTSVNFGAAIPDSDNAFVYVFKGFFGGYFAGFKEDSFFRHHHNYAEQESRTLWNYELNLTEQQLYSLVRHLWELKHQKFDYYYINDNCASRMAELLSVVTDKTLIDQRFPWVQPITIFQKSIENDLVREVHQFPSHYEQFLNGYNQLSSSALSALQELDSELNFNNANYLNLSTVDQISVTNVLLDYYDYQIQRGIEFAQANKAKVVQQRFLLPPGNTKTKRTAQPPHLGQFPVLTQLGIVNNNDLGTSVKLRLRPTYYDLLSIDTGRLSNSSLAMGDTEIEWSEQGWRVTKFDLANILTLSPAATALETESNLAWKVRFGLESTNDECYRCMMPIAEVGLGKSFARKDFLGYGLLELRFQGKSTNLKPVSVFARAGFTYSFSSNWKSQLEYRGLIEGKANSGLDSDWQLAFNNRFGSSRDWDIRLNLIQQEHQTQTELKWSRYW